MDANKSAIKSAYDALRAIKPTHSPQSPEILHQYVLPYASYAPWLNDSAFVETYAKIREHTLVDIYRCWELWSLAVQLKGEPGAVLEVGVWRGGTGALLAKAVGDARTTYLADTFQGVVKAGEKDTNYVGGEHSDTSRQVVEDLVAGMGCKNVVFLEGIFPEDTAHLVKGPIIFCHCDVDVYQSARDVVNWTLDRLVPGGMIVFDDYGFKGCEGVTRFVNNFDLGGKFRLVHNLNGHALLVKI
jgi:O-methyltransferase